MAEEVGLIARLMIQGDQYRVIYEWTADGRVFLTWESCHTIYFSGRDLEVAGKDAVVMSLLLQVLRCDEPKISRRRHYPDLAKTPTALFSMQLPGWKTAKFIEVRPESVTCMVKRGGPRARALYLARPLSTEQERLLRAVIESWGSDPSMDAPISNDT